MENKTIELEKRIEALEKKVVELEYIIKEQPQLTLEKIGNDLANNLKESLGSI